MCLSRLVALEPWVGMLVDQYSHYIAKVPIHIMSLIVDCFESPVLASRDNLGIVWLVFFSPVFKYRKHPPRVVWHLFFFSFLFLKLSHFQMQKNENTFKMFFIFCF